MKNGYENTLSFNCIVVELLNKKLMNFSDPYNSAETESMITMLVDLKPNFFNGNKRRRPMFVAFVCATCFLLALPMATSGGMYLFQEKIKIQFWQL